MRASKYKLIRHDSGAWEHDRTHAAPKRRMNYESAIIADPPTSHAAARAYPKIARVGFSRWLANRPGRPTRLAAMRQRGDGSEYAVSDELD